MNALSIKFEKLGNILMQRTERLMQNKPRSSEDKTGKNVVRFRQVNKLRSFVLDNMDCATHKQPTMLRHCSAATACPMLS